MSDPSHKRLALALGIYVLASALGTLALDISMSRNAPSAALPIAIFYGPTWFLVNGFFGGIHGAPQWSYVPSFLIAVFSQNALIWWLSTAVNNKLRRRQNSNIPHSNGD